MFGWIIYVKLLSLLGKIFKSDSMLFDILYIKSRIIYLDKMMNLWERI